MIRSLSLFTLAPCRFKTVFIVARSLLNKYPVENFYSLKAMEDKEAPEEQKDSTSEYDSSSSSVDLAEEEDRDLNVQMDKIRKFIEEKLHFFEPPERTESVEKCLKETSLDGIIDFIKDKNITKIITMAGAGISTSAGIPDFRSPKSGLYDNLDKYNLPHPQAIFELDFFKKNPEPFFTLAKELMPEGYKPTPAHYFIRLLWEKGLLLRHYTQNIDTLERIAGIPPEKIVEAHGTFNSGHCLECKAPYDLDWMKAKIKEFTIPKCEECNTGIVKPDIVFFGESLSARFHRLIDEDYPQAELLIIMGSSLVVQPFASLVDNVKTNVPRLLINKEKIGKGDRLSRFLGITNGLDFDSDNFRDVALIGDCDTGCQLFADKMGWGDELKDLVTKEHERLDKEAELKEKAGPSSQSDKASNL